VVPGLRLPGIPKGGTVYESLTHSLTRLRPHRRYRVLLLVNLDSRYPSLVVLKFVDSLRNGAYGSVSVSSGSPNNQKWGAHPHSSHVPRSHNCRNTILQDPRRQETMATRTHGRRLPRLFSSWIYGGNVRPHLSPRSNSH